MIEHPLKDPVPNRDQQRKPGDDHRRPTRRQRLTQHQPRGQRNLCGTIPRLALHNLGSANFAPVHPSPVPVRERSHDRDRKPVISHPKQWAPRAQLSEQPRSRTPAAAIITPVTPVIAPVLTPLTAPAADQAGSIAPVSEQWHLTLPFRRPGDPLAPRRSAPASGSGRCSPAHRPTGAPPSQTAPPTSSPTPTTPPSCPAPASPQSARFLLREQHRKVTLQRAQLADLADLADLAVVSITKLDRVNRAITTLRDHHDIEHPDRAAIGQRPQLSRHLTRETRLARRKANNQVINRPQLVDIDVSHRWPPIDIDVTHRWSPFDRDHHGFHQSSSRPRVIQNS